MYTLLKVIYNTNHNTNDISKSSRNLEEREQHWYISQSYSNQTSFMPSKQTCTSTTREHSNTSVAGCFLTVTPQIHVKERAVSLKWMLWKMNIHLQYWNLTLITPSSCTNYLNTNQPHTQRSETLLLKGMTGRETLQDADRGTRIKDNIRQMEWHKTKRLHS